jgi:hypothetical protein
MPDDFRDDVEDLAQQLCVRAGMLMEDFSGDAVSLAPKRTGERAARIEALKLATSDMAALVAAAEVLERRFVEKGRN